MLFPLFQDLDDMVDADAIYFLMKSINLLCLHGECLNYTVNDHEEFVKHLLKKLTIPK